MKARRTLVALVALLAVACASPARGVSHTEASPPRSVNRAPKTLCAREIATLGDADPVVDGPAAPPNPAAPHARKRRVVLVNRLPSSHALLGIALSNGSSTLRVEAPAAGPIGEIEGVDLRGKISVLVQAKRAGGLYDYVGDCEVTYSFLGRRFWNARLHPAGKLGDIVVVVDLEDGRPVMTFPGVPDDDFVE